VAAPFPLGQVYPAVGVFYPQGLAIVDGAVWIEMVVMVVANDDMFSLSGGPVYAGVLTSVHIDFAPIESNHMGSNSSSKVPHPDVYIDFYGWQSLFFPKIAFRYFSTLLLQ
jgi:hypothetical protein